MRIIPSLLVQNGFENTQECRHITSHVCRQYVRKTGNTLVFVAKRHIAYKQSNVNSIAIMFRIFLNDKEIETNLRNNFQIYNLLQKLYI